MPSLFKNVDNIKIDFDPSSAKKYVVQKYNIVVVDVLRATSTIIVAINRGAKEVIPCAEIEEAVFYQKSKKALLVGERHAEKIEGFDFTNSPFDLAKESLNNKTVIITTSTGTRLISECLGATHVLIGSTLNVDAVAKRMVEIGEKWAVIGAGSHGEFRPEDQVGCSMIAKKYLELSKQVVNSDAADFIQTFTQNIETHIKSSPSSQKLIKIGRRCDVDYVVKATNWFNNIPFVKTKTYQGNKYLSITA